MLNKHLCKLCDFQKHGKNALIEYCFEERWQLNFRTSCGVQFIVVDGKACAEPPDNCPYVLEQLMATACKG